MNGQCISERSLLCIVFILVALVLIISCDPTSLPVADRTESIPPGATKISPQMDENPPVSLSDDFDMPVPIPGSVNSAGGEDSPFITADGKALYFWFTPDVSLPAEKQVGDGVSGIYASHLEVDGFTNISRVLLQDSDKLALDGCAFVSRDLIWFCSAREGYEGIHWFTAGFRDGKWNNWQEVDFDPAFEVGELHISSDGKELYFASHRAGGSGGQDIWVSQNTSGVWQEPEPVSVVNTADNEGYPALSPDDSQLWFSRNYGIWRSLKSSEGWQAPELIFSPLAGEPTIDQAGNVYFVHHFYHDNVMLEADIYVAYKK